MYPNSLQIFHFCCIHGNKKKNSSHVAIRNLKLNDIKSLLVVIYEKDTVAAKIK
jgi:hypothetical protein